MTLRRTLVGLTAVVLFAAAALIPAAGSRAQESIGIAAVVNDDAISMLDVYERMRIVLITANLEDTPETRQRLFPQILRALIDERLQRQEGERQGVELSDAEIKAATDYVENSIGLPEGQLVQFLEYNNIGQDAFMQQIRTELIWNKLVEARMRQANITEDEVEETLDRMIASANEPAYLLAEIFIAVDDPSREGEALANMERLAESLRSGANFQAIARQFSQSASSAAGGDLGWILENQLPADVREVVVGMTPGSMSPPIDVIGGYKLILLRDRRIGFGAGSQEAEIVLRQVLLPVAPQDDADAVNAEANQIAATLATCDDFEKITETVPQAQVSAPVSARLDELQAALVDVVSGLPVNQPSTPLRSEMGYHIVMVCERIDVEAGLPSRQEIHKQLEDQQFDLIARGYLRDLRRTAFIDVRI